MILIISYSGAFGGAERVLIEVAPAIAPATDGELRAGIPGGTGCARLLRPGSELSSCRRGA